MSITRDFACEIARTALGSCADTICTKPAGATAKAGLTEERNPPLPLRANDHADLTHGLYCVHPAGRAILLNAH